MKYKLGVALSGGGYRAVAFHLGTLRFLSKAGLLPKIDCFSTVSGGSIIGATYCLESKNFETFEEFELLVKDKLQKSVIGRVLWSFHFLRLIALAVIVVASLLYFTFFTSAAWVGLVILFMSIALLVKFQFRLFPVSEIIEGIYDDLYYNNAVMSDLPEKPILIVNSTNLQTGRLFYFTKDSISDSTYDNTYDGGKKKIFNHERFPISKAVMCSSCVPSFFTPIEIDKKWLVSQAENIRPILVDGGVYDNQGIHKLTHKKGEFECATVIVSDAGNQLPFEGSYNNILTLLMRTVEVFMNRIKMFQMMINLYQNREVNSREIAYITLGWNIESLISGFVKNFRDGNVPQSVIIAHHISHEMNDSQIIDHLKKQLDYESIIDRSPSPEQVKLARSVKTNLTALNLEKIDALSLYAEIMTEVQVKLYCPNANM